MKSFLCDFCEETKGGKRIALLTVRIASWVLTMSEVSPLVGAFIGIKL
jgi:hypothetical protein